MKLHNCLLTVSILSYSVAAFGAGSTGLNSWDDSDLKEYLEDHGVKFDQKKTTLDDLRELAAKQWASGQKSTGSSLLEWANPFLLKERAKAYWRGDSVLGGSSSEWGSFWSHSPDYANSKNWVFSTWEDSALRSLLERSGINAPSEWTHGELAAAAHDNYERIAKELKHSGKYPGDWLYSGWSKKELKRWLDDHGVDYSILKDSTQDLRRKVRQHSYEAARVADEERGSLLESLAGVLSPSEALDRAGKVKDEVFKAWSTSQLARWLELNRVPVEEKIRENQEKLVELAQKHKQALKNDVDLLSSRASSKASEGRRTADNLVNDTFLVGVESWSRDRLKQFLKARGVDAPLFATKYELVELVKKSKYKPLTNYDTKYFFEGWTPTNVKKWLKGGDGSSSESTPQQVYNQLSSQLKDYAGKISDSATALVDSASKKKDAIADSKDVFFNYWSDIELRSYLESFGLYNTKKLKHEDLLDLAKKHTNWFLSGDQTSSIATAKLKGVNAWNKVVFYVKNWFNRVYYTVFS